MNAEQHQQILQQIADAIARRGLIVPARIALDVLAPLGFLSSQVALFLQPLTPLGRWRTYLTALEDEESWQVLQRLVDRGDC
jgi:hypothetical protein